MDFERVLMVWDFHDGPRSGLALHKGLPHYFRCELDKRIGEFPKAFELCPVSDEFLLRAEEQWKIYRAWESKFHHGLVSLDTHPGHRGTHPRYDELEDWLNAAIGRLKPLHQRFVPRFRALPDQHHLPAGVLRELEVAWVPESG